MMGKTTRILLIDDSLILAHAVRELFASDASVAVRCCWDSANVISEVQEFNPTVILQNLGLKGIGPLTLLKRLHSEKASRDIPLLAISHSDDPHFRREVFARGAKDFMHGIPGPAELRVRVENLSSLQRMREERDQAFASLAQMQSEIQSQSQQLARASALDALTGLPSWVYFDERLAEEFLRAAREHTFLSLLLVEVDDFESHQRTNGIPAGDEMLRRVATVVENCIKRPHDHFARYNDEQFVLLLPETSLSDAELLAVELRWAVEDLSASTLGESNVQPAPVTVGGATALPVELPRREMLVAQADTALEKARTLERGVSVQAVAAHTAQRVAS